VELKAKEKEKEKVTQRPRVKKIHPEKEFPRLWTG
jgi:hypothetical protein